MFRTLALLLILASPVSAGDPASENISASTPVVVKSFASASAAGAYLTLSNQGDQPDLLIGVQAGTMMAMIHESQNTDGVMKMVHLDAVEVPAKGSVDFRPGGLHIMLMGLTPSDLQVGDKLDMTLVFERAGSVVVTFDVVDAKAAQSLMDDLPGTAATN